jgi:glutathione S-transferase
VSLTLYHIPDWASSIIRLALEELGLAHRIHPLDFDAGDFDTPAFRAVNPVGRIPALDTPDGPMFETGAILLWLIDQHGQIGPRPGDPDRAAFLTWLLYTANTIHPTVMAMIHPDRAAGPEAAKETGRLALEDLTVQAAHLETLITTRAPHWLSVTGPSALPDYLGILLRWAIYLPEDKGLRFSLVPFPALTAVLAGQEQRPAARRVAEADGLGSHPFTAPEAT